MWSYLSASFRLTQVLLFLVLVNNSVYVAVSLKSISLLHTYTKQKLHFSAILPLYFVAGKGGLLPTGPFDEAAEPSPVDLIESILFGRYKTALV